MLVNGDIKPKAEEAEVKKTKKKAVKPKTEEGTEPKEEVQA